MPLQKREGWGTISFDKGCHNSQEGGRTRTRRVRRSDETNPIYLSLAGADGSAAVPGGCGGERDGRQRQRLAVHHARPRPRRQRRGRQRSRRDQQHLWLSRGGSCAQDRPVLKAGARDLPQCPRGHDALGQLRHERHRAAEQGGKPRALCSRSALRSAREPASEFLAQPVGARR